MRTKMNGYYMPNMRDPSDLQRYIFKILVNTI